MEGALILTVGAIGMAIHRPALFTSLGPTAYEQVEKPHLSSARAYNVVVGHMVGLAAGFAALAMLSGFAAPPVATAKFLPAIRIWASVIAVTITVAANLLLKSGQPAALATALLVTFGSFQGPRDAFGIVMGVLVLAAIGEPVRRYKARNAQAASK
jgi:hypothetical protein